MRNFKYQTRCGVCGEYIEANPFGLCKPCALAAIEKLKDFAGSLTAEEQNFIDYITDGNSLTETDLLKGGFEY